MKYSMKYPRAVRADEPEEGIFQSGSLGRCVCCGELTLWIELNYEARVCSDECLNRIDVEAAEAHHQATVSAIRREIDNTGNCYW